MKVELNSIEMDLIIEALDKRTDYLLELLRHEKEGVFRNLTKDYHNLKKKMVDTKEWKVK